MWDFKDHILGFWLSPPMGNYLPLRWHLTRKFSPPVKFNSNIYPSSRTNYELFTSAPLFARVKTRVNFTRISLKQRPTSWKCILCSNVKSYLNMRFQYLSAQLFCFKYFILICVYVSNFKNHDLYQNCHNFGSSGTFFAL